MNNMAAVDQEERTGIFLRLLNASNDAFPTLDQDVTLSLRDVLSMTHNANVGPRLAAYLAQFTADSSHAAAAACVDAAVHGFATESMRELSLGPNGRAALLNGIEQVGLGARCDPFPSSLGKPCDAVQGIVMSADGVRLLTNRNEPLWKVVCPQKNSMSESKEMCYAVYKKIDDCRGGKKQYLRCFEYRR